MRQALATNVALRIGVAFDVTKRLGALDLGPFGAELLGPCVRCLRFAVAVADDHARLASGSRGFRSWPVGLSPLGHI